jgi:hypothetical protein
MIRPKYIDISAYMIYLKRLIESMLGAKEALSKSSACVDQKSLVGSWVEGD